MATKKDPPRHHTQHGTCVTSCGFGTHEVVYTTEFRKYVTCPKCLRALARLGTTGAQP